MHPPLNQSVKGRMVEETGIFSMKRQLLEVSAEVQIVSSISSQGHSCGVYATETNITAHNNFSLQNN
ncbi:hypothetical protein VNO77_18098 [Canavalia gladiata]|uniref:Uncharacterized protein n=1 Tax=Canavalia gladiata TaxID=3824 RepID=A0AAN9QJA7_CANGL